MARILFRITSLRAEAVAPAWHTHAYIWVSVLHHNIQKKNDTYKHVWRATSLKCGKFISKPHNFKSSPAVITFSLSTLRKHFLWSIITQTVDCKGNSIGTTCCLSTLRTDQCSPSQWPIPPHLRTEMHAKHSLAFYRPFSHGYSEVNHSAILYRC